MSQPQVHEIDVTTTTYQRADLDDSQIPPNIFAFTPPSTAKLVTEFETPTLTRGGTSVGKAAPDVTFDSPEGKKASLKSFQGRPVLLDFWATWCAPCVASLPSLARLYEDSDIGSAGDAAMHSERRIRTTGFRLNGGGWATGPTEHSNGQYWQWHRAALRGSGKRNTSDFRPWVPERWRILGRPDWPIRRALSGDCL